MSDFFSAHIFSFAGTVSSAEVGNPMIRLGLAEVTAQARQMHRTEAVIESTPSVNLIWRMKHDRKWVDADHGTKVMEGNQDQQGN